MKQATVVKMAAGLFSEPRDNAVLEDEVFCGHSVKVLEEMDDYLKVETDYSYKGWCKRGELRSGEWTSSEKLMVSKAFADVMSEPCYRSEVLMTLCRGGLVACLDSSGEWSRVELSSGIKGYMRSESLTRQASAYLTENELKLRMNLARWALSYLDVPYRFGGKTPLGIDCSGLCSAAYLLCGIKIHRDAYFVPGMALSQISPDRLAMGDVIYFKGHMAMYLEGGEYIHSTGRSGSEGVVISSLDSEKENYRPDLAQGIICCATMFARNLPV